MKTQRGLSRFVALLLLGWSLGCAAAFGQYRAPTLETDELTFHTPKEALQSNLEVVPDGAGGFISVYQSVRAFQGFASLYFLRVDSTGAKIPTSFAEPVAFSGYNQRQHDVVSDGMGGVVVTWIEEYRRDSAALKLQRLNGRGESLWGPLGIQVTTDYLPSLPKIALLDDAVYVVWREKKDENFVTLRAQQFDLTGREAWSKGHVTLARLPKMPLSLDVVPGRRKIFAVWNSYYANKNWKLFMQQVNYRGSVTWSAPEGVLISSPIRFSCQYPSFAPDGKGGFFTAMESVGKATQQRDIRLIHVNLYGDISYDLPICQAEADQRAPKLLVSDREVYVYWTDYRKGEPDLYAQRCVSKTGSVIGPPDGWPLATSKNALHSPGLINFNNTPLLFWEEDGATIHNIRFGKKQLDNYSSLGFFGRRIKSSRKEVASRRIVSSNANLWCAWIEQKQNYYTTLRCLKVQNQDGSLIADSSANQFISDTDISNALVSKIQVAKHQDYNFVAWKATYSDTGEKVIYIQKIDTNGKFVWKAPGIPVIASEFINSSPRLSVNQTGIVVSWLDDRKGNDDLYYQLISHKGVTQLNRKGELLCEAPRSQNNLNLTATENGAFWALWTDSRSFFSTGFDIYGQKFIPGRKELFKKNGRNLSPDSHYQINLTSYNDGAGGVIYAWMDDRNGYYNIFAQRMDGKGNLAWEQPHVRIAPVSAHQRFPCLVNDLKDNLYIGWSDDRYGSLFSRIFVQKLNASGLPQWRDGGVPAGYSFKRQLNCDILSLDTLGCIVSWLELVDLTNKHYTLHMQWLGADGKKRWGENGVQLSSFVELESKPIIELIPETKELFLSWVDAAASGKKTARFKLLSMTDLSEPLKVPAQTINSSSSIIPMQSGARRAILYTRISSNALNIKTISSAEIN